MTRESQTKEQMVPESMKVNNMGFIEKGTGRHQSNTVYGPGIAPTIPAISYKEPIKVIKDEQSNSNRQNGSYNG